MRTFDGVKAKLAMELTGFTGTPKTFRTRYRDIDDSTHKLYSAQEIRNIRMALLNIPKDTKRPRILPPIIDARMAKGGVGKTTISGNVASCLARDASRPCSYWFVEAFTAPPFRVEAGQVVRHFRGAAISLTETITSHKQSFAVSCSRI